MELIAHYFHFTILPRSEARKNQNRLLQNNISFAGEIHTDIENAERCTSTLKDEIYVFVQLRYPGANDSDFSDDVSDVAKKRSIGCLSYFKVFVSSAILCKRILWDLYCTEMYENVLMKEASSFILIALLNKHLWCAFWTLQLSRLIWSNKRCFRPMNTLKYHKTGSSKQSGKLIRVTRRRLHDSMVSRVVKARIKFAPGFQDYQSFTKIKEQPK